MYRRKRKFWTCTNAPFSRIRSAPLALARVYVVCNAIGLCGRERQDSCANCVMLIVQYTYKRNIWVGDSLGLRN